MSPSTKLEALQEIIDSWRGTKPVAGLMGEFSAGKSTLLNFVLEQDVAITRVTATPMPPTLFTYSDKPFAKGLRHDGTVEAVDLGEEDIDFREQYLIIQRGVKSKTLKKCDIIDAPGISDPTQGKGALRFLNRHLDFVIWCTAASQAWRQTEKSAFEKLAKATRENSVLVITRFDKLRGRKDQEKVLNRVQAETSELFATVIGLETLKANAVPADERTDAKTGAWVKTGGFGFAAALDAAIATTAPKAAKRAPVETKTVSGKEDSKPAAAKAKPSSVAAAPVKKTAQKHGDFMAEFVQNLNDLKTIPGNSQHCSAIDHLIATIPCEETLTEINSSALRECTRINGNDLEIERLASQISFEFRAFGNGPSVRIDI